MSGLQNKLHIGSLNSHRMRREAGLGRVPGGALLGGGRLADLGCKRQDGVVLLVVLILLLLTTIVGYQVMETSSLEARMAIAREGKEVSFQAAESIIDQSKNNEAILVNAFTAALSSGAWPTQTYNFTGDAELGGTVEVRYIDEIATLGNDLVIGNPGLRSLHFELRADTGRGTDDRFDAQHIQGIKRFAPKLQ